MDQHTENQYEHRIRASGMTSSHSLSFRTPKEVKGYMGFPAAHIEASTGGKWVEIGRSLWTEGRNKSKGPQEIGLQSPGLERKRGS